MISRASASTASQYASHVARSSAGTAGHTLAAKSRSQRSSTKLKLIVSCQPRSASAWRSALAPRRDSLATFACNVPSAGPAGNAS